MNVLIAGQKWFGAEVFRALSGIDNVKIVAVSAPGGGDRLFNEADRAGVSIIKAGSLNSLSMPGGVDLIVAAHSHDFIGEKTRLKATYGGIGYHPSLLPIHRGRDSIEWAIRFRDRVTGGTVYRLSNVVDGGDILEQRHVFIRPDDDAESLWRRELCPLGVRLLARVVSEYAARGYVAGVPQDGSLATWEPPIENKQIYRPDLVLIPRHPASDYETDETLQDIVCNAVAQMRARNYARDVFGQTLPRIDA